MDPLLANGAAVVMPGIGFEQTNSPRAATPRACTTRSGMRSRSKLASFSTKWKSVNRTGPRSLTVNELSVSPTGAPLLVVGWAVSNTSRGRYFSGSMAPGRFGGAICPLVYEVGVARCISEDDSKEARVAQGVPASLSATNAPVLVPLGARFDPRTR